MFGDPDDESVSDRLWVLIKEKLGIMAPVWIVPRPETLTIFDYRPTFLMFLSAAGSLFFSALFVVFLVKIDSVIDSFGFWVIGIFALALLVLSLRGTIREVYFFDKTKDSYAFVRQFVYGKEIIEGALSQFTGAYVRTQTNDDSETYFVMLKQEGMFLTGVAEQTLREEVPIFNSFDSEARIANAISAFLNTGKDMTDGK